MWYQSQNFCVLLPLVVLQCIKYVGVRPPLWSIFTFVDNVSIHGPSGLQEHAGAFVLPLLCFGHVTPDVGPVFENSEEEMEKEAATRLVYIYLLQGFIDRY